MQIDPLAAYSARSLRQAGQARVTEAAPSLLPVRDSGPDTVALSEQARRMAAQAFQPREGRSETGSGLALDGLAERLTAVMNNLDELTDRLESDATALLLEHGVGTTPPADLILDENGRVTTQGDHPDKARIEALFAARPDLRDRMAELAAASDLKQALQERLEFARAYAEDPEAAVARYGYLFSGRREEQSFVLRLGAGEEA